MRHLLIPALLALGANTAMADTFNYESDVVAALVYPQGATVTRLVSFDLPAGRHQLVLTNVPEGFVEESLRILGGEGLVFGAIGVRDTRLPPDDREVAERAAIQEQIDDLEDAIRGTRDEITVVGLRVDAANARIRFLEAMGARQAESAAGALDGGLVSTETLIEMVTMIGAQTLSAMQEANAARVEVATLSREMAEQGEEMQALKTALEAVALPLYDRALVSVEVTAEAAVEGTFQVEYLTGDARWEPVYDFRLDTTADVMTIERKAKVTQFSGELWADAAISLSTSQPSLESQIGRLRALRAYYFKPEPVVAYESADVGSLRLAAPSVVTIEQPARMDGAVIDFQGVTAVYHLPEGTQIDGDEEPAIVTINASGLDVDMTAQVNMKYPAGVFLIADFTNDSDLPILPGSARFYRDGAFVGSEHQIPMVAAGDHGTLGFGPINGLNAERITLRREVGESGVLTTSNDRIEEYELRFENMTGQDWDMVAYDRVPYSEQEDLEIDYSARPRPAVVDVDGKRGVLAWAFPLRSGETQTILFSYTLVWPDGHELSLQ